MKRRVWFLHFVGALACAGGCDSIYGVEDNSGVEDESVSGPLDAGDATPSALGSWGRRRSIQLTSNVSEPLADHSVLVVFPSTFDYERAKPGGEDLRFSRTNDRIEDIPYFIESWVPGGTSFVWIRPPVIPIGASSLHVFYGNRDAEAASSFEAVFPKAQRTEGGGAGSFTADGDIDVDWFELSAGDTLTLKAGVPLRIRAHRIIVNGSIAGDGAGFGPGVNKDDLAGRGLGGGKASAGEASGGGGYGGQGGTGGTDFPDAGGPGGMPYGEASDTSVEPGSGGGSRYEEVSETPRVYEGGAGGGAIGLFGWRTTVSGTVSVDGEDALVVGGGGGGGSGGCIVIAASFLELGGAKLQARGGAGAKCSISSQDGGGGGGGGRIKLHYRATGAFTSASSMSVAYGAGGRGGTTTAPGEDGTAGTMVVNSSSSALTGVEASLSAEFNEL